MEGKEIFEKRTSVENLISVDIKTDICDVFAKKSEGNELRLSVIYFPHSEIKETDNHISEEGGVDNSIINNIIGVYSFLEEEQRLVCELYETHLKEYFLSKFDSNHVLNVLNCPRTDIILELPQNAKLTIETKHSDINIQDISTEFHIESTDGDVLLQNAGHGLISSTNGFIKIYNIMGNLDINTEYGNIHLKKGVGGVLNINSHNGDIFLKEMSFNKISCKTNNGNIFAEMSNGDYDYMELISDKGDLKLIASQNNFNSILLDSKNGDTKISLPNDLIVNLDLSSENGEVEANIETEDADEIVIDTEKFYVNFGENLPNIQANTINGDIIVKNLDIYIYNKNDKVSSLLDESLINNEESQFLESNIDIINEVDDNNCETVDFIEEECQETEVSYDDTRYYNDGVFPKIKKKISIVKDKMSARFKKNDMYDKEYVLEVLTSLCSNKLSIEEAEEMIRKIIEK
ncbi:MAG: DUF4097 domain-containing protein [Candidatus Cloacimonetes bacterium]|nr:DUF4097 domain-containing protein [Candidatus Cloacimonadota bacterium]